MEYVISFLTFFLVYFSFTYIFRGIKLKPNVNESGKSNQKRKTINNKKTISSQKDKSELYRILKNSLMVSFVYIIIILIMKFFK